MFKKLHLKSRFWYLIPFIILSLLDSLTLLPIIFGALKSYTSFSASLGLSLLSISIFIILIMLSWKLYRKVSHRPPFKLSEILYVSKHNWKYVGLGIIGLLFVIIAKSLTAIHAHAPKITTNQHELAMALSGDSIYKYATIFCSIILASILEELLYRGVLMQIISPKLSVVSIIVSLLVFDILHQGFSISSFITYGGGGLIWALLYAHTHSLKSDTIVHSFCNVLAYLPFIL